MIPRQSHSEPGPPDYQPVRRPAGWKNLPVASLTHYPGPLISGNILSFCSLDHTSRLFPRARLEYQETKAVFDGPGTLKEREKTTMCLFHND